MSARSPGATLAGSAVAIFYIFLWASAYVPSKIASVEVQALWFLVARFAVAGAILSLAAVVLRRAFPRTARAWATIATIGVFANALYLGCAYTAMHRLSAGMGSIVASTNPLLLALVAPQLLGERLTPLKIVGLVLGFGGVVAVTLGRVGTQTALPVDVVVSVIGVAGSVASAIIFKRMKQRGDLLVLTGVQLLAAAIVLVPVALVAEGGPHGPISTAVAWSFVYLVLVLSVGASLIWFWLLTHGEASRVSAFYYLTPAFGLALSAILLGERVSARDLAGLVAIAAGIILVQRDAVGAAARERAA